MATRRRIYLVWYGITKSLVNAQWALWEEDSPEEKLRIKIAKKLINSVE